MKKIITVTCLLLTAGILLFLGMSGSGSREAYQEEDRANQGELYRIDALFSINAMNAIALVELLESGVPATNLEWISWRDEQRITLMSHLDAYESSAVKKQFEGKANLFKSFYDSDFFTSNDEKAIKKSLTVLRKGLGRS